jgi:DDE superfamily endonuclease
VSPEFVWHLEEVLDLYAEPYDGRRPQVCFDESPVPLISETRQPVPARPGQPTRYNYEYRREGTAKLFLCVQPLCGWRHVNVTPRRTKGDCARQMQELVDVHFPEADVIKLVVDNLNTHTPAAVYEILHQLRPAGSPGNWSFTLPPSMAAGSIGPNVNLPCSPGSV